MENVDEDAPLTDESFEALCFSKFNDAVMVGDMSVARLIGGCNGAEDYYYIVLFMGGERQYISACLPVVSLKGIYPRYDRCEWILAHNGAPQADEFIWEIEPRSE